MKKVNAQKLLKLAHKISLRCFKSWNKKKFENLDNDVTKLFLTLNVFEIMSQFVKKFESLWIEGLSWDGKVPRSKEFLSPPEKSFLNLFDTKEYSWKRFLKQYIRKLQRNL